MTKKEASHHWRLRIQASVKAPAAPMSREFQAWVKLQQSLVTYPASFHGAVCAAYRMGPNELDSVIRALSQGFDLARQQMARKPSFRR